MQVFRLVNAGFVDKLIAFDELPERLMKNIKTRAVEGLPRSWARWLGEVGSTRVVYETETERDASGTYRFTYTPIGKEPCFYILEYTDINSDKEAWRAISEYLRMHVGSEVRLREKVEDMAVKMAPDCVSALDIEPEDIPVIKVPVEGKRQENPDEIVKAGERIIVEQAPIVKKQGRPRKKTATPAAAEA